MSLGKAAIAAVLLALGAPAAVSAQQGPASPPPPVATTAANDSARSSATLRQAERGAEVQRKLTEGRLKRRDLDAQRTLGSICKGC